MKLLKTRKLYFIFIILIIIDYFALYQWSKIKVDDILISKPIGYKYSSVSIKANSTFDIFKNNMGLITNFSLSKNHFLRLEFRNIVFRKSTTIVFFKFSDVDKLFISNNNVDNNHKCTKKNIVIENNKYTKRGVIYKSDIIFDIVSDNKDDLYNFYNQICK